MQTMRHLFLYLLLITVTCESQLTDSSDHRRDDINVQTTEKEGKLHVGEVGEDLPDNGDEGSNSYQQSNGDEESSSYRGNSDSSLTLDQFGINFFDEPLNNHGNGQSLAVFNSYNSDDHLINVQPSTELWASTINAGQGDNGGLTSGDNGFSVNNNQGDNINGGFNRQKEFSANNNVKNQGVESAFFPGQNDFSNNKNTPVNIGFSISLNDSPNNVKNSNFEGNNKRFTNSDNVFNLENRKSFENSELSINLNDSPSVTIQKSHETSEGFTSSEKSDFSNSNENPESNNGDKQKTQFSPSNVVNTGSKQQKDPVNKFEIVGTDNLVKFVNRQIEEDGTPSSSNNRYFLSQVTDNSKQFGTDTIQNYNVKPKNGADNSHNFNTRPRNGGNNEPTFNTQLRNGEGDVYGKDYLQNFNTQQGKGASNVFGTDISRNYNTQPLTNNVFVTDSSQIYNPQLTAVKDNVWNEAALLDSVYNNRRSLALQPFNAGLILQPPANFDGDVNYEYGGSLGGTRVNLDGGVKEDLRNSAPNMYWYPGEIPGSQGGKRYPGGGKRKRKKEEKVKEDARIKERGRHREKDEEEESREEEEEEDKKSSSNEQDNDSSASNEEDEQVEQKRESPNEEERSGEKEEEQEAEGSKEEGSREESVEEEEEEVEEDKADGEGQARTAIGKSKGQSKYSKSKSKVQGRTPTANIQSQGQSTYLTPNILGQGRSPTTNIQGEGRFPTSNIQGEGRTPAPHIQGEGRPSTPYLYGATPNRQEVLEGDDISDPFRPPPKDLHYGWVSEHEHPRDIPTRLNYPGGGLWAQPPPNVDLPFKPKQIYSQVRRHSTVKFLPRAEAIAAAATAEELINAPRLREVISHKKTQQVYEEEGFEDTAYDHGAFNKHGEKKENEHKASLAHIPEDIIAEIPDADSHNPDNLGQKSANDHYNPVNLGQEHLNARSLRPLGRDYLSQGSKTLPTVERVTPHGTPSVRQWKTQMVKSNEKSLTYLNDDGQSETHNERPLPVTSGVIGRSVEYNKLNNPGLEDKISKEISSSGELGEGKVNPSLMPIKRSSEGLTPVRKVVQRGRGVGGVSGEGGGVGEGRVSGGEGVPIGRGGGGGGGFGGYNQKMFVRKPKSTGQQRNPGGNQHHPEQYLRETTRPKPPKRLRNNQERAVKPSDTPYNFEETRPKENERPKPSGNPYPYEKPPKFREPPRYKPPPAPSLRVNPDSIDQSPWKPIFPGNIDVPDTLINPDNDEPDHKSVESGEVGNMGGDEPHSFFSSTFVYGHGQRVKLDKSGHPKEFVPDYDYDNGEEEEDGDRTKEKNSRLQGSKQGGFKNNGGGQLRSGSNTKPRSTINGYVKSGNFPRKREREEMSYEEGEGRGSKEGGGVGGEGVGGGGGVRGGGEREEIPVEEVADHYSSPEELPRNSWNHRYSNPALASTVQNPEVPPGILSQWTTPVLDPNRGRTGEQTSYVAKRHEKKSRNEFGIDENLGRTQSFDHQPFLPTPLPDVAVTHSNGDSRVTAPYSNGKVTASYSNSEELVTDFPSWNEGDVLFKSFPEKLETVTRSRASVQPENIRRKVEPVGVRKYTNIKRDRSLLGEYIPDSSDQVFVVYPEGVKHGKDKDSDRESLKSDKDERFKDHNDDRGSNSGNSGENSRMLGRDNDDEGGGRRNSNRYNDDERKGKNSKEKDKNEDHQSDSSKSLEITSHEVDDYVDKNTSPRTISDLILNDMQSNRYVSSLLNMSPDKSLKSSPRNQKSLNIAFNSSGDNLNDSVSSIERVQQLTSVHYGNQAGMMSQYANKGHDVMDGVVSQPETKQKRLDDLAKELNRQQNGSINVEGEEERDRKRRRRRRDVEDGEKGGKVEDEEEETNVGRREEEKNVKRGGRRKHKMEEGKKQDGLEEKNEGNRKRRQGVVKKEDDEDSRKKETIGDVNKTTKQRMEVGFGEDIVERKRERLEGVEDEVREREEDEKEKVEENEDEKKRREISRESEGTREGETEDKFNRNLKVKNGERVEDEKDKEENIENKKKNEEVEEKKDYSNKEEKRTSTIRREQNVKYNESTRNADGEKTKKDENRGEETYKDGMSEEVRKVINTDIKKKVKSEEMIMITEQINNERKQQTNLENLDKKEDEEENKRGKKKKTENSNEESVKVRNDDIIERRNDDVEKVDGLRKFDENLEDSKYEEVGTIEEENYGIRRLKRDVKKEGRVKKETGGKAGDEEDEYEETITIDEVKPTTNKNLELIKIQYDEKTTEIPVDVEMYPFYAQTPNEGLARYSPLRYAVNPKFIPRKTGKGMEFYDSRDHIECDEDDIGPSEDFLPEKKEDGELVGKPVPNGPRLKGLGDKIRCLRTKYFGSDPLDNPFFKEETVSAPKVFASERSNMQDQLGLYADIMTNIKANADQGGQQQGKLVLDFNKAGSGFNQQTYQTVRPTRNITYSLNDKFKGYGKKYNGYMPYNSGRHIYSSTYTNKYNDKNYYDPKFRGKNKYKYEIGKNNRYYNNHNDNTEESGDEIPSYLPLRDQHQHGEACKHYESLLLPLMKMNPPPIQYEASQMRVKKRPVLYPSSIYSYLNSPADKKRRNKPKTNRFVRGYTQRKPYKFKYSTPSKAHKVAVTTDSAASDSVRYTTIQVNKAKPIIHDYHIREKRKRPAAPMYLLYGKIQSRPKRDLVDREKGEAGYSIFPTRYRRDLVSSVEFDTRRGEPRYSILSSRYRRATDNEHKFDTNKGEHRYSISSSRYRRTTDNDREFDTRKEKPRYSFFSSRYRRASDNDRVSSTELDTKSGKPRYSIQSPKKKRALNDDHLVVSTPVESISELHSKYHRVISRDDRNLEPTSLESVKNDEGVVKNTEVNDYSDFRRINIPVPMYNEYDETEVPPVTMNQETIVVLNVSNNSLGKMNDSGSLERKVWFDDNTSSSPDTVYAGSKNVETTSGTTSTEAEPEGKSSKFGGKFVSRHSYSSRYNRQNASRSLNLENSTTDSPQSTTVPEEGIEGTEKNTENVPGTTTTSANTDTTTSTETQKLKVRFPKLTVKPTVAIVPDDPSKLIKKKDGDKSTTKPIITTTTTTTEGSPTSTTRMYKPKRVFKKDGNKVVDAFAVLPRVTTEKVQSASTVVFDVLPNDQPVEEFVEESKTPEVIDVKKLINPEVVSVRKSLSPEVIDVKKLINPEVVSVKKSLSPEVIDVKKILNQDVVDVKKAINPSVNNFRSYQGQKRTSKDEVGKRVGFDKSNGPELSLFNHPDLRDPTARVGRVDEEGAAASNKEEIIKGTLMYVVDPLTGIGRWEMEPNLNVPAPVVTSPVRESGAGERKRYRHRGRSRYASPRNRDSSQSADEDSVTSPTQLAAEISQQTLDASGDQLKKNKDRHSSAASKYARNRKGQWRKPAAEREEEREEASTQKNDNDMQVFVVQSLMSQISPLQQSPLSQDFLSYDDVTARSHANTRTRPTFPPKVIVEPDKRMYYYLPE